MASQYLNQKAFQHGKRAGLKLWHKGIRYWLVVLVLIVGGYFLGVWLERQEFALDWRYKISDLISQGPRQPFIQRTVLVLINDDEYWKGKDLARRTPIRRDYLAALVDHLDHADPAVIAIDFDLRSPVPDGTLIEHEAYVGERDKLLDAVKSVSKNPNRWIILPRTIRWENGDYLPESDILDVFDFKEDQGYNVKRGYLQLPYDIRRIPLQVRLKDGKPALSFAEAIVRATNERALKRVEGEEELPYGTYLKPGAFEQFSATEVISENSEAFKKIRHNIVIIGAGWSKTAYGRGGPADSFATPVGPVRGAMIHANFVEALLDNRTSAPWSERVREVIEILLVVILAIAFALLDQPIRKALGLLVLILIVVGFSYFSWLNLGHFYDFSIPLILIGIHAVYEQFQIVLEWRRKARASHHRHASR